MARPQKNGLDYFPLDVDMDQDDKIALIEAQHGVVGFAIVIKLLMKIYKSSYFYEWTEKEQLLFSKRINVDINSINVVINDCIKWGLFDRNLLESKKILTSKGIQSRYLEAVGRRTKVEIKKEYLLLDEKAINVYKNLIIVDINHDNEEVSDDINPQSKVKKSKVKESKEERAEGVAAKAATLFPPDSFEMLCVNTLIHSCLEGFPGAKVPVTDEEKSQWCDHIEKMKWIDHRTEAQIEIALKYAVTNQFWKANIRSTKKFREKFETLYMQSQAGKTAVRMEDDKAERLRRWAENE